MLGFNMIFKLVGENSAIIYGVAGCGSLLTIVAIVALVKRKRSRKGRLLDSDSSSGYSDCDRTMACLNMGQLPMTVNKITMFSEPQSGTSSDNDTVFRSLPHFDHQVSRPRFGSFQVDRVQPDVMAEVDKRSRSEGYVPSYDKIEPTVMMTLASAGSPRRDTAILKLIKASNLKRNSLSSGLRAAATSSPNSGVRPFIAIGVVARIFKRSQVAKTGSEPSCDQFEQTKLVKSKKAKNLNLAAEKIQLKRGDFPVRVTLYEMDRHHVRLSLGHCFLDIADRDQFLPEKEIVVNRILHANVFKAQKCALIVNQ
ncbi:hypothetical protein HDE_06179 [Halotydeus destructor]|nr:hypothetical protein HDE_06179 [Halotydeus destructor]